MTDAHNPQTGEWNDSLTGDFIWSNVKVGEAVSVVMTPPTCVGVDGGAGTLTRLSRSDL